MNTLVKTLLLSVAAAGFSMSAAARDVRHRWCPPEETPAPVTEQPIPQPQVERINLSADALFRFNRSGPNDVLPAGKATLDELAGKLISREAQIDSIALIGHTDRLGSEQYNYALGLKRAETVKSYLAGKGVKNPISVSSAGETQPVTENCVGNKATAALKACLQPDRRVTVEITGSETTGTQQ